jgi:hypothetical protein
MKYIIHYFIVFIWEFIMLKANLINIHQAIIYFINIILY